MPALKDEMVLNVDGIISVDPAISLRQRAQAFIASRKWSTASIFYGDQAESEFSKEKDLLYSFALAEGAFQIIVDGDKGFHPAGGVDAVQADLPIAYP